MIREQSRFTINPLYVVAVAMCTICQYVNTLQQGLLFGLLTAVICLLCTNLVSLVEKIADKNLRAFLITMLTAVIIVILEYVFELLNWEILTENLDSIKWIIIAVTALSIVPTYFETRLTTRHYFINMFFSVISFFVLIVVYSVIIEVLGFGSIFGYALFGNFGGFVFAGQLYFKLFVIALLIILTNFIYQVVEDRKMRFDLLVEKYKLNIKQVLNERDGKGGTL